MIIKTIPFFLSLVLNCIGEAKQIKASEIKNIKGFKEEDYPIEHALDELQDMGLIEEINGEYKSQDN